jgi:hypothetical protein
MEQLERATRERAAAYYNVAEKVITLASTLLAVTITFRNSLLAGTSGRIQGRWLLFVAWICLAVSVATGLLALFGDVRARTQAIRMMIASGGVGGGKPGRVFEASYFVMALSFSLALTSFVAFAIANTAK